MIRRAVREEARRIAEIQVISWRVAYDSLVPADYLRGLDPDRRAAMWRKLIEESGGPVFVSSEGDRIVGFCHVTPSRDEDGDGFAEITAFYVDPSFWRLGHGRALCGEAVSYATNAAFRGISLWVISENQRARRFYEAMGFSGDGRVKSVEGPGFVLEEVRYRRVTSESRVRD